MRILVTFATPQEFAPWKGLRPFRRLEIDAFPAWETQIGEADVRVALTGMGQLPAFRVTRLLMEQRPDASISSGLAGGLRPEHQVGRVLVARSLRMEDERFLIKSHDRLRRVAAVCGARVVDTFFSSEHVVLTAREKAALGLAADAVEMESYAVLTEAARCRVPAVAVRAISDTARADLPLDFNRVMDGNGRLSWPRLLGQVARRPQRVPGLLRFGAESRRAAESLAKFLDVYVQALAGRPVERGARAGVSSS
jgi:nucleoside phosphorylase